AAGARGNPVVGHRGVSDGDRLHDLAGIRRPVLPDDDLGIFLASHVLHLRAAAGGLAARGTVFAHAWERLADAPGQTGLLQLASTRGLHDRDPPSPESPLPRIPGRGLAGGRDSGERAHPGGGMVVRPVFRAAAAPAGPRVFVLGFAAARHLTRGRACPPGPRTVALPTLPPPAALRTEPRHPGWPGLPSPNTHRGG